MKMLTAQRKINTLTMNAPDVSNNKMKYVMVPENKSSISFQGKVSVEWDHAPSIMVKLKFISAQIPGTHQTLLPLDKHHKLRNMN